MPRGRPPLPRPDRPTFPPFRDYQRKAIDSMKRELLTGVPAGLNSIPTGGGKTLVSVAAKWEIEQETDKRVHANHPHARHRHRLLPGDGWSREDGPGMA
jgi:Rad3-related DNA helicase